MPTKFEKIQQERIKDNKIKAKQDERAVVREVKAVNIDIEKRKVHPESPEQAERRIRNELAQQAAQTIDREDMNWSNMSNELLYFDPNFRSLADYFNVESKEYGTYKKKLSSIYEWGKRYSKGGINAVLSQIKKQERKLGSRPLEPRINTFYQWAALDNNSYQANLAKQNYER